MTQHYIGTKIVEAWPQEQDGQLGYAVKYPDGYISWCPVDQFKGAYLAMGYQGHLAPHLQRLVGEEVQLSDRILKLSGFITDDVTFLQLSPEARDLLKRQLHIMEQYQAVLDARLRLELP